MEYMEAKAHIQKYTSLAAEKYSAQGQSDDSQTDKDVFQQEIWTRLDRARNINEFLQWAGWFYEKIELSLKDVSHSSNRAAALRDMLIFISWAVISLLVNMYGAGGYEELFKLDEFENLIHIPAFSLGMYMINEGVGYSKNEELRPVDGSGKEDAEDILIAGVVNQLVTSTFRKILYVNYKGTCWWCTECGLMTRDRCLAILLEYFCPEEDADAEFIMVVSKLISPGIETEKTIDRNVDDVIAKNFGTLPEELKQQIIEQCSYRNFLEELSESALIGTQTDPCPRKVLESVIRQHVTSMIQTMWTQDGERQACLKFNCIDCAYVSARMKEYVSDILREKSMRGISLTEDSVEDNHDYANATSSVFNIILSDIHVMVITLKSIDAQPGKIQESGQQMELCIRMYCRGSGKDAEKYPERQFKVPFCTDDYELEALEKLLKEEKILETAVEYRMHPAGADFHYSLIYLENYRGIDRIALSFDHMFAFSRIGNKVELEKADIEGSLDHFYGSKILSLTGFVGKNGAGKSSVVDFLRDSFLKICRDLYTEKLHAYNGCVDIKPENMKYYRLNETSSGKEERQSEGTVFFIIFYFNGKYYYLTNLLFEGVTIPEGENQTDRVTFLNKTVNSHEEPDSSEVLYANADDGRVVYPYSIGDLLPMYSRNRKIVYFSQFLAPAGITDEENSRYSKDETAETLQGGFFVTEQAFTRRRDKEDGIIDLSEEVFSRARKNPSDSILNKAIVMQLLFYYSEKENLKKYFGDDFSADDLAVRSPELEPKKYDLGGVSDDYENLIKEDSVFVRSLTGQALETVLKDPLAYIRPFSSGQYSKFALLSKLYWCVKGWKEFEMVFAERGVDPKHAFADPLRWEEESLSWEYVRDEMMGLHLQDTDAGVLFFDEADTYYHPDWQREFVQDILKMVEDGEREEPLQIVFTTNSPLMLSDLRQRDIYLMKDDRADSFEDSVICNRDETRRMNPSVPTFGQNIHTLMAKPFFLKRTIGAFADERIESLVGLLIDVTDLVEFLEEKRRKRSSKYKNFIATLEANHKDIFTKTMKILTAVEAARRNGMEDRRELRKCEGKAEGEYVIEVLIKARKKSFADTDSECMKYKWTKDVLKYYIDLIGEGVLRNELTDMYNDFTARTEPLFHK